MSRGLAIGDLYPTRYALRVGTMYFTVRQPYCWTNDIARASTWSDLPTVERIMVYWARGHATLCGRAVADAAIICS